MTTLGHAIVFVSDMDRSVNFYRDVLGFSLRFASPEGTEFDTGGTTLALHATGQSHDNSSQIATSPPGRCQFGLSVDDLEAFHHKLMQQGVTCLQAPRMETIDVKLAKSVDPDGLPFSVSERQQTKR